MIAEVRSRSGLVVCALVQLTACVQAASRCGCRFTAPASASSGDGGSHGGDNVRKAKTATSVHGDSDDAIDAAGVQAFTKAVCRLGFQLTAKVSLS